MEKFSCLIVPASAAATVSESNPQTEPTSMKVPNSIPYSSGSPEGARASNRATVKWLPPSASLIVVPLVSRGPKPPGPNPLNILLPRKNLSVTRVFLLSKKPTEPASKTADTLTSSFLKEVSLPILKVVSSRLLPLTLNKSCENFKNVPPIGLMPFSLLSRV